MAYSSRVKKELDRLSSNHRLAQKLKKKPFQQAMHFHTVALIAQVRGRATLSPSACYVHLVMFFDFYLPLELAPAHCG